MFFDLSMEYIREKCFKMSVESKQHSFLLPSPHKIQSTYRKTTLSLLILIYHLHYFGNEVSTFLNNQTTLSGWLSFIWDTAFLQGGDKGVFYSKLLGFERNFKRNLVYESDLSPCLQLESLISWGSKFLWHFFQTGGDLDLRNSTRCEMWKYLSASLFNNHLEPFSLSPPPPPTSNCTTGEKSYPSS